MLIHHNENAKAPSHKANMLNTFFYSVFTIDDENLVQLPRKPSIVEDCSKRLCVEIFKWNWRCEILWARRYYWYTFKTFSNVIATSLTQNYNYSLTSDSLPKLWKEAQVRAIHKKESKHSPNNYRPVSMTCITWKLLAHIILKHIYEFLDKNNLLCDSQHCFGGVRLCNTQLVYTVNDLAYNRGWGFITDIILSEFSKASTLSVIANFWLNFEVLVLGTNWCHRLKISRWVGKRLLWWQTISELCVVSSGVPQGSV